MQLNNLRSYFTFRWARKERAEGVSLTLAVNRAIRVTVGRTHATLPAAASFRTLSASVSRSMYILIAFFIHSNHVIRMPNYYEFLPRLPIKVIGDVCNVIFIIFSADIRDRVVPEARAPAYISSEFLARPFVRALGDSRLRVGAERVREREDESKSEGRERSAYTHHSLSLSLSLSLPVPVPSRRVARAVHRRPSTFRVAASARDKMALAFVPAPLSTVTNCSTKSRRHRTPRHL